MDHSSNNILVNVSGAATIPVALGVNSEGEHEENGGDGLQQEEEQMAATPAKEDSLFLPENILSVLVGLIEKFNLTREQFLGIYDEYEKIKFLKSPDVKTQSIHQQLQVAQEASTLTHSPSTTTVTVEGTTGTIIETGDQGLLHGR